jgi:hypothetical protein
MRAVPVLEEVLLVSEGVQVELVAWLLPAPSRGSEHGFKYRLALIVDGTCVLRYDNEAGKGDHRHLGSQQHAYRFIDLQELKVDFWKDVDEWLRRKGR